jgi:sugar phosphate isomerase/epimerase
MMKLAFTTLGCPAWDLDTICRLAPEYGFQGVDFRGYLDTLDVTTLPEFTRGAAATRRKLNDAGLEISGVSSSITVCDRSKWANNLEEARRTIAVTRALGAPNVRIYGGGDLTKHSREELAKIGCEGVEQLLALDGAESLHWLFETHDNWIKSTDCRLLLDAIPNAAFGALWDIGHTPRVGGETPAETYAAIGPRVGNTHIKDAVYEPGHPRAMQDGWRYVFPGTGQLPLAEAVNLLRDHGYDGWLTFEHEKRWHPNLPEPEEIFPAFTAWARGVLA